MHGGYHFLSNIDNFNLTEFFKDDWNSMCLRGSENVCLGLM